MKLQFAPAQLGSSPDSATLAFHDRWLAVARTAWITFAVLALGLFALAVYARYLQLVNPPEAVRESLAELGLSVSFYATYHLAFMLLFAVACFAIAAVIARRRWEDPVGLFVSLFLILLGAAQGQNSAAVEALHPALAFPARFVFFLLVATHLLFLFVFPNGRFVPRWTQLLCFVWVVWLAVELFFLGEPLAEGPSMLGVLMLISGFGTGIAAQVYRYLRVSNPVQRQQTKWVVFGTAVAVVGFLGVIIVPTQVLSLPVTLLHDMLAEAGVMLSYLLIPLAIGFAILRYRLWDIDLIINRTLVCGALTASVIGMYVLVVGGVSLLFQARGSLLVSLFATGLVAVLFQPLRDKLQRTVNRLMYGERDDPSTVLTRLGQRLEATLAPEAVLPAIVETVKEALKLPYAAIALKQDEALAVVVESGSAAGESIDLPLVYQNDTVGQLILAPRVPGEAFSPADWRLLKAIAHQAGVAIHAVRLNAALQRSRERLVTAREEERRRLRRDLHDGLGPQLAGLTLKLETARNRLAHDPLADTLLGEISERTQAAVADIRRLVYALRPPALDELGLISALCETAAQYGKQDLKITVDAPESLPPLSAAAEVAAYRIAQEALTNVVRHAQARTCTVRLELDAGLLSLEIRDDGRGLGAKQAGVGLRSMRERAEELGGICLIASLPTGGTQVLARLPSGAALPKEA